VYRLARFKHPHVVIQVEALPRNGMGKVRKHELRSQFPSLIAESE
jgi:non-ribosomal peptide synthetase component E (peptide arylation enzyme)